MTQPDLTHRHLTRFRRFVLAATVLATSGCVQATADVPDLEVTRENIAFEAAPAATPAGLDVTVVQQFSYDKAPVTLPKTITSDMRATEVTITLRQGADDLSFVHAAQLTVTRPDNTTQTVVQYLGNSAQKLGTSVTLPVQSTNETASPWSADSSVFELSITGYLPRQTWYVDVSIKYSGTLAYSP